MNAKHGAVTRGERTFDRWNAALLLLTVLICAYPIYYTLIASFSDPDLVLLGRIYLIPRGVTLESYQNIFRYKSVWTGYINSILYTFAGTAYNLLLLIPASYALAKKTLRGRNLLMGYFVFTMYFSGGLIPTYLLLKSMSLINTRLVMILPSAVSIYNLIITRTFFSSSVSEELGEAAKIDGASEARIFIQIVLPLSGSIIAVMTLYCAVAHWNSYFNAMLYLNDQNLYPLQLVLRNILVLGQNIGPTENMSTDELESLLRRQKLAETMKYALIILSNLPVLIAYPLVQKYFVKGVMIGALKG